MASTASYGPLPPPENITGCAPVPCRCMAAQRPNHPHAGWAVIIAALPLQVCGLKPCALSNPGEHARTDLFSVVEGKDEVRPSGAREDAMGAILPFDAPVDAQECREDSSRSRAGPGTHAAAKEMLNRSGPAAAWSRRSAPVPGSVRYGHGIPTVALTSACFLPAQLLGMSPDPHQVVTPCAAVEVPACR
jgi:hypothetical protein